MSPISTLQPMLVIAFGFIGAVISWQSSYDYLLADFGICYREKPDIVVWIQGRVNGTAHRPILRELIANKRLWPPDLRVVTLFFVGRPYDRVLQPLIEYEFEQYHDIVQNDYEDHYRNQTAKLISAITFLADYCGMSKLAIRLDDDIILNPANMIKTVIFLLTRQPDTLHLRGPTVGPVLGPLALRTELLKQFIVVPSNDEIPLPAHKETQHSISIQNLQENSVVCYFFPEKLINRNVSTEFYGLDYRFLPHRTHFPEYCAGFFIAFTSNLLPKFKALFKVEEPFWIDDAYLGILQERLKTNHIRTSEHFHYSWGRYDGNLKTILDSPGTTIQSQSKTATVVHLSQRLFNLILGHFGFLKFET